MGKFETDERLFRIEQAIKELAELVLPTDEVKKIEKTLQEAKSGEKKDDAITA